MIANNVWKYIFFPRILSSAIGQPSGPYRQRLQRISRKPTAITANLETRLMKTYLTVEIKRDNEAEPSAGTSPS